MSSPSPHHNSIPKHINSEGRGKNKNSKTKSKLNINAKNYTNKTYQQIRPAPGHQSLKLPISSQFGRWQYLNMTII